MPFQSEAQRRYLWANEPEIARDWADTYGSRVENNTGGISRLGFADRGSPKYNLEQYKKERGMIDQWMYDQMLEEDLLELERKKKVREQKHMAATGGLMRLGYLYGGMSHPGGRRGFPGGSGQDDYAPMPVGGSGANYGPVGPVGDDAKGQHIQDQIQTSISKLGAPPGMSTSTPHIPTQPPGFFSNLKDKIFQGRGDYDSQADWQAAKDKRIGQKRIDRILNRSDEFPITENTYKNLMDAGWTGGLPTLGSTATSRGDRNTYEGIRGIDVPQNKLVDIAKSVTTNQADAVPISGTNNYWDALNMKPINIGMNQDQLDAIDKIHKRNLAADDTTNEFFYWHPQEKHIKDFVEDIKEKDTTEWFSDTPTDIVRGDPTTGATTQEIKDYINSLKNKHGVIPNYAKKRLEGYI